MGSFPQSIVHYLPVTDHDERWGIVCTTAGYQNVPPGSPYPLTQQPDSYSFTRSRGRVLGEYQLLYIVSGQGEFRSASSPAAPVKAGTVVMLFPDEWHTYAPDPETGWEEWWVGFRGENIDRRVAEGFFSPKTPLLHIGHSAGIVSCYQEIIRSAEEERKGFQQLVTGIVLHLLGSVLFKRDNLQYLDNPIVEKINRAREMMRRHIGDNLPPEEIARRLNIGYTWFRRTFRAYVGIAPAQYQLQLRHNKARELLTTTDRTVSEIAAELGFENVSQFSAFFRQREKITATQYRSKYGFWPQQATAFRQAHLSTFRRKGVPKTARRKCAGIRRAPRRTITKDCAVAAQRIAQLRLRRLGKVRERPLRSPAERRFAPAQ